MDLSGQHRRAIDMWFDLLADTPSDAPYADDIRDVIRNVGQKYKIDVDKRLAGASRRRPPAWLPMVRKGGLRHSRPDGRRNEGRRRSAQGAAGGNGARHGRRAGGEARAESRQSDGWIMLMRSRMQLGEPGKAGKALQDGLAAFRNDQAASRRLREAAAACRSRRLTAAGGLRRPAHRFRRLLKTRATRRDCAVYAKLTFNVHWSYG
jgi:cytochrome c-type biogenesis protein CcmH